ncbi:transglycosylase domain-containing protein [Candidatus Dojkabacteria bacterium]|uniref:peptidoglycan glycosyltransferase n=1 Tax=Candidatus Dojkabacteria bacterium TaxID=2099670 RepID=A0A955L739_9BACT|nr:transglycosylase domain-containing protein [Candidatus Dojkabacteria bacterium]
MTNRKSRTLSGRRNKYKSRRPYSSKRSIYNRTRVKRARKNIIKHRLKKYTSSERFEKVAWSSLGFLGVIGMIGAVGFLFWLKNLTQQLPDIHNPFDGLASSTIYAKDGEVLYSVSPSEFSRDLLQVNEQIPEELKWAFLSAEDEAFYEHPGVDFTALTRCVFYKITGGPECGGSTITQQVVLNTVIAREQSYVRKIKDIILALQLERIYDKDQVINIYLNVVPMGGGRLGVKTGSKFYFGKELNDLTLPEMSVLASVVRNPSIYSPTVGSDLESNKANLYDRTAYILDQMIQNIDRINDRIDIVNEENKDKEGYIEQEHITVEDLESAKEEVKNLEYKEPKVDIKAPHFVFYVIKLLQERAYNNGEPFTESDIQTGGLKIYTTLDYSLQEIAEKYVSSSEAGHAGWYRNNYAAHNSALLTLQPDSGEILAMVGSKCYQNNEYIQNCDELDESEGTLFDPDVNILTTLQSPGSTNKAIGYYVAFNEGIISTASVLPDVPINNSLSPGYSPKNWNGGFSGKGDVRSVFAQSLNIPALFLIDAYGVQKYIDTARDFGYTTYGSADGYGPSVILGGTDVKGVEHAQAFGVFANGGDFVEHEVVSRIVDIDGNTIYEHQPKRERIAEPSAVYLVNNVLNPRVSGSLSPVKKITDRDVAGKTGTSENNRDTWFSVWSPEFVTVGWMGNNDNTPMSSQAFGSTSAAPWIQEYMNAIMSEFPNKTPFTRPAGVGSASEACAGGGEEGSDSCSVGLSVAGKAVPSYLEQKSIMVCVDQPDRIARDIDIAGGFAVEKTFTYLKSPSARLQKDVDSYFLGKEDGLPSEECDIERTSNPTVPKGVIISPLPGGTYNDEIFIDARAFLLEGEIEELVFNVGNRQVASTQGSSYSGTASLNGVSDGLQEFEMEIHKASGGITRESFMIYVGTGGNVGSLSLAGPGSIPSNGSATLSVEYDGSRNVDSVSLYQTNSVTGVTSFVATMVNAGDDLYEYNWSPNLDSKYTLYAVAEGNRFSAQSNVLTITVGGDSPEETGN